MQAISPHAEDIFVQARIFTTNRPAEQEIFLMWPYGIFYLPGSFGVTSGYHSSCSFFSY